MDSVLSRMTPPQTFNQGGGGCRGVINERKLPYLVFE